MSFETLGMMFEDRVKKFGDKTLFMAKKDGEYQGTSWSEANDKITNLSLGFIALGVKHGDKVSLLSENRPEWIYTDMSLVSIGAVSVPIYATNTPSQVEYVIKDSGSRFVVVSSTDQLAKVLEVKQNLPNLERIIIIDPLPQDKKSEGILEFGELLDLGEKNKDLDALAGMKKAVKPDDLACFIYTSGTTGDPKGVMLSHGNFMSNAKSMFKTNIAGEDDISLSFLPLSHSFERMAGYIYALYTGMTVAYAEGMDRDVLLKNMAEVRPTIVASVPRFYEKIHAAALEKAASSSSIKRAIFNWSIRVGGEVSKKLQKKETPGPLLAIKHTIANALVLGKIKERVGGRLKFFISGGAPLAKEIAEFFHAAGIQILEGYGLTETSPLLTINMPDAYKFGTVGKVVDNVEIKIAPDGEVIARGANIMKGYWNKPEDTKEVLREDGWFMTGDIGEIDADGFLKITDRKKDIIVTAGGKNLSPQNVENSLKQERYIEQVCIIGDKRPYCVALIVPAFENLEKFASKNGITFSSNQELVENPKIAELIQANVDSVNSRLAKYETIKKFKLIADEFTQENDLLTPTLKVKRKLVTQAYQADIDAMYGGNISQ